MLTGHFFKRLKRRPPPAHFGKADRQAFLQYICDHIVKQFTKVSHLTVVATPVDLRRMEDSDESIRPPAHPECVDFARTDYCRESWQLHLVELLQHPKTHWHKCDYGRCCAVVPLVHRNECLAVFKLVCPDSLLEPEFEAHVGLLDVLVEHAAATEAATLSSLFPPVQVKGPSGDGSASAQESDEDLPRTPSHPQVLKALEYVEHSLSDPKLTVSHVAEVHDVHPDYLAHLFRKEVGQRMSRYISARRIDRAKNLLATTTWCVKRVAYEAGFANPKWFYHVFRTSTGLTPNSYRREARDRDSSGVRNP